jgi:hypothetical protein
MLKRCSGSTRVELLVVIAIMGVLVGGGVLLPTIQAFSPAYVTGATGDNYRPWLPRPTLGRCQEARMRCPQVNEESGFSYV